MKLPLLAATLACFSLAANADEAEIRKAFESKLGKIEKIAKSPVPGLWEIVTEGQVLYVDDKGTYLLHGSLVEVKTLRNLTAERMRDIEKALLAGSLDAAIKQVRGSGKNVIMTFEDPNCGYCKKLAKEIQSMKDVTVYTFLFPILTPDSATRSRNIWCAADPAKAWKAWMLDGQEPAKAECDTPIQDNLALGRKLNVQGTPALFFADGTRVNGALPLEALKKKLDALGQEPAPAG